MSTLANPPAAESAAHNQTKLRRGPAVGVFGHFGDRNLGDEAIIEALIARIQHEWPAARVVTFSMDPADTAWRYDLSAFPIRQESGKQRFGEMRVDDEAAGTTDRSTPESTGVLDYIARFVPKGRVRTSVGKAIRGIAFSVRELAFLVRSFGRVRGLDALFIAGSNQFLDNFGGPWGFPYTLLKWSLMCRLAGCRVYFVSVGAGPLDAPRSHALVRKALRLSDYASFRDEGSQAMIESIMARPVGPVVPDLAHGLAVPAASAHVGRRGPLHVAINAMPVHDPRFWPVPDQQKYRAYVGLLARFTHHLLRDGHAVSFFATHFPDARVALDVRAELAGLLPAGHDPPVVSNPMTVQQLMGVLADADIVVATRYHGILLALHSARPVLGICYYRKARELMRTFEQEDYAIDLDGLDESDLAVRLERLVAQRLEALQTIERVNARLQGALESQYRTLFDRIATRLGES